MSVISEKYPEIERRLGDNSDALELVRSWITAITDRVKNPVAGVSAAATILDREIDDYDSSGQMRGELAHRAIQLIRETMSQLNNYVDELGHFSLAVQLEMHKVYAHKLVQLAIEAANSRFHDPCIIDVTFDPPDLQVECDPEKIVRALTAIMVNAFEAVPNAATPKIRVISKKNRGSWSIAISDNGCGFPKNDMQNAFRPFFTTKDAGTGLGLAIAQKYMTAHGGGITIGNDPDFGGACVTAHLPITNVSDTNDEK